MIKRLFFACALAFISCQSVNALEAEGLDVEVQKTPSIHRDSPHTYVMRTSGFVRATMPQVWRVLSDYERHPGFVPNLLTSKIVSRHDNDVLLEQHGRAGFLFVKRDIRLVVRITEHAMNAIDIVMVSGDMKHYEAHWKMTATSKAGIEGTRIDYAATMAPDFFVPPLIGPSLIQQDVRNMTQAVMTEIEKRAAE